MLQVTNIDQATPWHEGELKMQRSIGVAERMDGIGRRFVRSFLLDQHREFYPLLPFVVVGAVDPQGDAWATLRAGKPGFLAVPDAHTLSIHGGRDPGDPADAGLDDADSVGLLGIELHSRRRNRLNGKVRRSSDRWFDVVVAQSYGNCPQYVQQREFAFTRDPTLLSDRTVAKSVELDEKAKAFIREADTFFVASYIDLEGADRQVDVSHRGGKTGFVRIGDDGVLTIPDFAGNLFFNTLGNISLNPKSGLTFVDFHTGDVLQLTGDGEVVLDSPEIAAFQGAERLWRFRPRTVVRREAALPLVWKLADGGWSPNSLMTGSWDDAAKRLEAAELAQHWRRFRVKEIVEESRTIRSLHLEPIDGAGVVPNLAGQHLPIRITPPGAATPVIRDYTLSVAPSDGAYRISVKREGVVSSLLHDLAVGELVEARAPAGSFTIDAAEKRPAVLLAAGVGITPMLAMLRHVVYEGARKRRTRSIWLFYSAHTKAERAFDQEIASLVAAASGAVKLVRLLGDPAGAVAGLDYDEEGRIGVELLKTRLHLDDYDFYMCGPPGFMQSVYDGLRDLQVADSRIHAEAFGPSGLTRRHDAGALRAPAQTVATNPTRVAFVRSAKEARWTSQAGTLLDLAESRGLAPAFSCRRGSCGTCAARILQGAVAYGSPPAFDVSEGLALICCAKPAETAENQTLQLDV
jgi:ferredoxin-NADP reductase/predicted pyridoxine 5'-phosphate oxidase superfamily flavin-nucleotide-binding protein